MPNARVHRPHRLGIADHVLGPRGRLNLGQQPLALVLQRSGLGANFPPALDVVRDKARDNAQNALGVLQKINVTLGKVDRQRADNLLANGYRQGDEAPAFGVDSCVLAAVDPVLKARLVLDAGNDERLSGLDDAAKDSLAAPVAGAVVWFGPRRAYGFDIKLGAVR